jgi:hypothetical protein
MRIFRHRLAMTSVLAAVALAGCGGTTAEKPPSMERIGDTSG